jgi:hypothetical protein
LKRYELGSLLFKALGMFLIWGSFTSLGYVYYYLVYRDVLPVGRATGARESIAALILMFFGLMSIAWSDLFGRWIYRFGVDEPVTERLSARQIASIVFAGIGVVFVAVAAVGFASDLLNFFLYRSFETPGSAESKRTGIIFAGAATKDAGHCLLGLWLFFKAQPLAVWWSQLRDWHPQSVAPDGMEGAGDPMEDAGAPDRDGDEPS